MGVTSLAALLLGLRPSLPEPDFEPFPAPPKSATGIKRAESGRPGWAPYCLMCSTMGRMTCTPTGFVCEGLGDHFGRAGCGNKITWDLTHDDA